MKTKKNLFCPFSAVAFATAVFAMSSSAHAQSWDGGGGANPSWNLNTNWNPDTVPAWANTTALTFDVATSTSSYLGGAIPTVKSITFGDAVDAPSTFDVTLRADFTTGVARNLTFSADTGNATLTVGNGSTGNVTIGVGAGASAGGGSVTLTSNLDIVHNGSGELLINRPIQGTSGFTKTGTGTFRYVPTVVATFSGAININEGRAIFASGTAGADFASASAVNLGGGILEVRTTNAINKTLNPSTTVSAASTLVFNNTTAATQTLTIGTGAMTLDNNLTLSNISSGILLGNGINLTRVITGAGDLVVETYNEIDDSLDNFGLGRVQLSGGSPSWTGDLVITRGTVSLSGNTATTTGSATIPGDIVIGADGGTLGAGLTFNTDNSLTYANDIIVNPGGFRAIKGNNFNTSNMAFNGAVTLTGSLTLDHSRNAADRRISLNGPISGIGGLTITRAEGNTGSSALLAGASDYSGPTTVKPTASLALSSTCSLKSDITVENTGRIGGAGSTTKSLTLQSGAKFFFFFSATFAPMNVAGTVTLDNSFDINTGLVGGSQGEPIPWANVAPGTYTLIGGTSSTFNTGGATNNIGNFGLANQVTDVGGVLGKNAYFQNGGGTSGGGLQLVVTGPSGFDSWKSTNVTTGGLDEDHDDDGVDNGTEYFLFGNASTTGFTALPGVIDAAGVRSVTWQAASINAGYAGVYGIHFTVETSDTLEGGSWVTAPLGTGPGTVSIPFATAAQVRNVKYTFPTTGTKKFARLKVTGP